MSYSTRRKTPLFDDSLQPRRSKRLSSSSSLNAFASNVRFPEDSRSPTPNKLNRKGTPARRIDDYPLYREETPFFAPKSESDLNRNHRSISGYSDGSSSDECIAVPRKTTSKYPSLLILNNDWSKARSAKKLFNGIKERLSAAKADRGPAFRSRIVLALTTVVLLFTAFYVIYNFGLSGEKETTTTISGSLFDNARFALLVAPEFVTGLLSKLSFETGASEEVDIDFDTIVDKVMSDAKFDSFIAELRRDSLHRASEMNKEFITETVEDVVRRKTDDGSHAVISELQSQIRRLQIALIDEKEAKNAEMSYIRSQVEEMRTKVRSRKEDDSAERYLATLDRKLSDLEADFRRAQSDECCEGLLLNIRPAISEYVREAFRNGSSDINRRLREDYLPRSEFERSGGSSGGDVGVRRIVREALNKYDADKTGMFDFALESAGGTIVSTRCTQSYDASYAVYYVWRLPFWWEKANNPRTILQPGTSPGQCWAFRGSQGAVVVGLSRYVRMSAFSLEHIPKILAPRGDVRSAPKRFAVLGLTSLEDENPIYFGNFTYDDDGDPVQTFRLTGDALLLPPVKMIELKILSNYGYTLYTCLYRFRVHGAHHESEASGRNY